jgi:hypothetical protein
MERRDTPSDLGDLLGQVLTCAHQRCQPTVFREPSHHHQVVARGPIRSAYVGNAEIHVLRETTVQLDLSETSILAQGDR